MEQSTIQGLGYLVGFLILLGAMGLAVCKAIENSEGGKNNEGVKE